MHLSNQETRNILFAKNEKEVRKILDSAQNLADWDGEEPLSDHAPCLFSYLSQFSEEQRGSFSEKELALVPGGTDGSVRFEFFGEVNDDELENVSGGGCMDGYYNVGAFFKPVIYLYPERETNVTVEIPQDKMQFTCVYPALKDGRWEVTAKPDGTLSANGNTYNYLYWEGKSAEDWVDVSRGFCVPGADTAAFLEKSLAELGLNRKEANEMIVFWLPLLQRNPYNLISFQFENYSAVAPLHITPAPDTVLRVYMVCKPLQKAVEIEPQELTAPQRRGFTVVEWGGTI